MFKIRLFQTLGLLVTSAQAP